MRKRTHKILLKHINFRKDSLSLSHFTSVRTGCAPKAEHGIIRFGSAALQSLVLFRLVLNIRCFHYKSCSEDDSHTIVNTHRSHTDCLRKFMQTDTFNVHDGTAFIPIQLPHRETTKKGKVFAQSNSLQCNEQPPTKIAYFIFFSLSFRLLSFSYEV